MQVSQDLRKDRNRRFYQTVEKQQIKLIDKDIDLTLINQKITKIKSYLQALSQDQRLQWAEIHGKKLQELFAFYKLAKTEKRGNAESSLKLREHLRMLVLCAGMGIDYQAKKVQAIIREVYSDLYQQKVRQIFAAFGYPVSQMQTLQFQEDKNESWLSFWCCCSKKQQS